MLQRLRNLLAGTETEDVGAPDGRAETAAAVLIEAALADGKISAPEHALIVRALAGRFDVSRAEAEEIVTTAERRSTESAQIFRVTQAVKEQFPPEERVDIIELLWEVILVDGQVDDLEANLMRRLGGLLYVSDRDVGAARLRASDRMKGRPIDEA